MPGLSPSPLVLGFVTSHLHPLGERVQLERKAEEQREWWRQNMSKEDE